MQEKDRHAGMTYYTVCITKWIKKEYLEFCSIMKCKVLFSWYSILELELGLSVYQLFSFSFSLYYTQ